MVEIVKCKIQGSNATVYTDDAIVNNNSDTSKHFDNYNSGVSTYNSCIYVYSNGYVEFYIYALSSTTFRVRYDDSSQDYTTAALSNLSGTLYGPASGTGSKDGCYITWGAHSTVITSLSDSNIPIFYDWDEAKAYISGPTTPPYSWQSVPSISGKNGTLSLTQILNINDGEPVEDVTKKSNLDFSKKTKINTLINSAYEPTYSEDETKATVSYDIPESDYQYTKLVYKKKKIPKSASDGDAIDLNADATEIVINNLDENSKYYFKIFTDKTQSNSYKYSTGSNPPVQGKWKETISYLKMITG